MIKNLVFKEEPPTTDEYIKMRKNVGWDVFQDLGAVKRGLANSLYHICARKDDELLAMGRVIGDGSVAFYIQDIAVSKEYQGKGIGTQVMNRIMNYITTAAIDNAWVGLIAGPNKESFYEKFGFVTRPNESGGSGMVQIYNSSSS